MGIALAIVDPTVCYLRQELNYGQRCHKLSQLGKERAGMSPGRRCSLEARDGDIPDMHRDFMVTNGALNDKHRDTKMWILMGITSWFFNVARENQ